MENTVFFEPKSWWKDDIYRLQSSSCFELFRDEKYGGILAQKLMERYCLLITEKFWFWTFPRWKYSTLLIQKVYGKMIFTDYWKILVLNFSVTGNKSFFSQNVDGKMVLLGLFELSMIFQDLGNMDFCGVSQKEPQWNQWAKMIQINMFTQIAAL